MHRAAYAVVSGPTVLGLASSCGTKAGGALILCLYAVCIGCFLLLQGSDPGYIGSDFDGESWLAAAASTREDSEEDDDDHEAALKEEAVERCARCRILRPRRAHHCRVCNKCVACFDHHCKVLGTCIGEKNHCRFLGFLAIHLISLSLGLWINGSCSQCELSSSSSSSSSASIVLLSHFSTLGRTLAWLLLILVILPLFGQHCTLACTNATSHECMKSSSYHAPYSRGVFLNLWTFCCLQDGIILILWRSSGGPSSWEPAIHRRPVVVRNGQPLGWMSLLWENRYWSCC